MDTPAVFWINLLTSDTLISQITIVCPDVLDETGEYYTKNDVYINSLRSKCISVEILHVANEGISYTQYVKCFKKYNNFDYYIIMLREQYEKLSS